MLWVNILENKTLWFTVLNAFFKYRNTAPSTFIRAGFYFPNKEAVCYLVEWWALTPNSIRWRGELHELRWANNWLVTVPTFLSLDMVGRIVGHISWIPSLEDGCYCCSFPVNFFDLKINQLSGWIHRALAFFFRRPESSQYISCALEFLRLLRIFCRGTSNKVRTGELWGDHYKSAYKCYCQVPTRLIFEEIVKG